MALTLCRLALLAAVLACCHGDAIRMQQRQPWMSRSNGEQAHSEPRPLSADQENVRADDEEKSSPKEPSEATKKLIDEYLKKYLLDAKNKEQAPSGGAGEQTNAREEVKRAEAPPPLECGYAACDVGKEGMLNVHLVPHTHDDVGWLKTVDEYFYGSRPEYADAGVQYILDTVFQELREDPGKKFIYVEMAFFSRWWDELHDSTKHLVRGLVNTGQLEFTLGGWCMNDEAATHYSSIIDQHTLGFRFLESNFGECGRPRVGWQIDPFGHSREQASLFAQFGFDGQFFSRIDYQDMDLRLKTRNMETVWLASESIGDQASLFTGVMYNGYGPPGGFCFECGDTPIMDDPRLEDYNVNDRVNDFINAANDQAKNFATNHIMMTMGSDFQYQNARVNFKNYDKLIRYVNERQMNGSKVNVFYSTPACYVYAMNRLNMTYSSKMDDFFPYGTGSHSYLTGFFTSRPALKGYERTSNNFLQVCKQLDILSDLDEMKGSFFKIDVLRRAMGVLQHHDAVSGTERQHVAFDYARQLAEGVMACQEVISDSFAKLLPLSSGSTEPMVHFCPLRNASYCPASENNMQFVAIVYNPLGHNVSHWVRIPVTGRAYSVMDSMMNNVNYQLVPITAATASLPDHMGSKAINELVFATMLPPLGFSSYFVKETNMTDGDNAPKATEHSNSDNMADINIKNEYLSVTFSGTTGLLMNVVNLEKNLSLDITQSLRWYAGHDGTQEDGSGQESDNYVFRPKGTTATPIATTVMTSLVQGSEVQEVHQTYSDWASQVFRLYKGSRHLEVEYTVGHIPIGDKIGKEIISRFETMLQTKQTYYTDSNGREILKRVRDHRDTWTYTATEPIAGNYYPVNSRIFIQDTAKDVQLTVLTDRSQGGASIIDGQMEIMIHRRLLNDDFYGEALNETGLDGKGLFIRAKHYIVLDNIASSAMHHRELAQLIYMSPILTYLPSSLDPTAYAKLYRTTWSGLKRALPPNVHLLTLEQYRPNRFLLRLEHFYARSEDSTLSQPASVQLQDLFAPFAIDSLDEVTLGANQRLADATRLQWNVANYGMTSRDMKSYVTPVDPATLTVVLKPMQIRSFLVSLRPTDILRHH